MMNNPLLTIEQFPDYAQIKPEHAKPAIETLCENAKKEIEQLLSTAPATWATYEKIEAIGDKLSKAWSPISHLHSVMNSDDWRAAYADCQPIIAQYSAVMSQHTGLYHFYCQLRDSAEYKQLNSAQQKLINDEIRDFKLSGVNLSEAKKAQYQKLMQSASELYTTFSNNVLDATQAFHLHITDAAELAGIPESALALYRQLAEQNGVEGYWITLDFPSYVPALTYADNRSLREKLYHTTRRLSPPFFRCAKISPLCWVSITTASYHWPTRWPTPPTKSFNFWTIWWKSHALRPSANIHS